MRPYEASICPARGVPQASRGYSEIGAYVQWYALGWGTFAGEGIMAMGSLQKGEGFCRECLAQMNVVEGCLISVIVRNLNEMRQSPAKL